MKKQIENRNFGRNCNSGNCKQIELYPGNFSSNKNAENYNLGSGNVMQLSKVNSVSCMVRSTFTVINYLTYARMKVTEVLQTDTSLFCLAFGASVVVLKPI